jgi:hypothetical protein
MSRAVRMVPIGLVAGLLTAGLVQLGAARADSVTPPSGESTSPPALGASACSACTLRHQSMTRRAQEMRAAEEARGGCRIKGDITPDGDRVYHRPDDPSYQWVWVDEAAGERWFCSVGDAEAAGWHGAED